MRVALYARVSREPQERRGTIASQLNALRRYAQEHSHKVVEAYVCVDDGYYSGRRLDRPGLDRLRDGAEAGAFEAVLVLCPDRLALKYAYQMAILEELDRFEVRVIFLKQPPSTPGRSDLLESPVRLPARPAPEWRARPPRDRGVRGPGRPPNLRLARP